MRRPGELHQATGVAVSAVSRSEPATTLDDWLCRPARRVAPAELGTLWHRRIIRVVCRRPEGVHARPSLLNKIRGALGEQLKASASPAAMAWRPCNWDPPCGLDLLFRARSLPGLKAGVPPPYVLAADETGEELEIAMTLFGAAEACAGEAAEALVRALRGGLAIHRGWQVALEPLDRRITAAVAVRRPDLASLSVTLEFLTPVVLRSENRQSTRPEAVVISLFHRVLGLARWHGVEAAVDAAWLSQRLRAVSLDASRLVPAAGAFRLSENAPTGGYAIEGVSGMLTVGGDWAEIWPLLAIGETSHAGGRATQGYGRYRLTFVPSLLSEAAS